MTMPPTPSAAAGHRRVALLLLAWSVPQQGSAHSVSPLRRTAAVITRSVQMGASSNPADAAAAAAAAAAATTAAAATPDRISTLASRAADSLLAGRAHVEPLFLDGASLAKARRDMMAVLGQVIREGD